MLDRSTYCLSVSRFWWECVCHQTDVPQARLDWFSLHLTNELEPKTRNKLFLPKTSEWNGAALSQCYFGQIMISEQACVMEHNPRILSVKHNLNTRLEWRLWTWPKFAQRTTLNSFKRCNRVELHHTRRWSMFNSWRNLEQVWSKRDNCACENRK